MTLAILSFLAGVLTVAAPCVMLFLPVIVGGSVVGPEQPKRRWTRPLIVALSLFVSVVVFSLLLKASTVLLDVPQMVWQVISGGIIIVLGLYFLGLHFWEPLAALVGLPQWSNKFLGAANHRNGMLGAIMTGAALGPVFSSCSPTYAFIVAAIIPTSVLLGTIYLLCYALGMAVTLFAIAVLGTTLVTKLRWLSNPSGWFRHTVGVIFVVIGIGIVFGLDKTFQTLLLELGWYDPITQLEHSLRRE